MLILTKNKKNRQACMLPNPTIPDPLPKKGGGEGNETNKKKKKRKKPTTPKKKEKKRNTREGGGGSWCFRQRYKQLLTVEAKQTH